MKLILDALRSNRTQFPSEVALARDLGIPQRTLNDILNERMGIGTKTLMRILAARPDWINLINRDNLDDNGNQPPAGPS